jgi:hypothetical protein
MKIKMLKIKIVMLLCLFTTNLFAAGFMAIANVSKVKGKATINKEQIKVGSEIVSGVEISIPNKNDYVEVKFQNGHIVRFTGTELKVGEFTPKAAHFDLAKGKVLTTIKSLTPNEMFEIKTAHGLFNVQAGKNTLVVSEKSSHLEVASGSVTVKSNQGTKEVLKGEKMDFKN